VIGEIDHRPSDGLQARAGGLEWLALQWVAYALCLRPLGFSWINAPSFWSPVSFILGERRWHVMIPVVALLTAGTILVFKCRISGFFCAHCHSSWGT